MAKILLVEDDNNLREIYEARLQAEGYEIVSAMDGEEALVVAKKEKPDLVISDVMMPRISGFEMLDILRNTDGLKDVRVIMLTALGQAEDKTRADSLGADRYLVKSQVTLEDIVKSAQELLGGGEAAPEPAAPEVAAPAVPVTPEPPTPAAAPTPAPAAPAAPAVAPAPSPVPAPEPPAPAPAPVVPTPTPPMPPTAPAPASPTPPAPAVAPVVPVPATTPVVPPEPAAPAPAPTPSDNQTTPPAPAVPAPESGPAETPMPVLDAPTPTAAPATPTTEPEASTTSAAPAVPDLPMPGSPPALDTPTPAPAEPTAPPELTPAPETPVVEAPAPEEETIVPPAPAEDAQAEPAPTPDTPPTQSTSDEQATIKAQIENFVKQNNQTAPGASPAPVPEGEVKAGSAPDENGTDSMMADAIKGLVSDADDSGPTPVKPAGEKVISPLGTQAGGTAPAPAPSSDPKKDEPDDGDDNGSPTHKKIISPITDGSAPAQPDLNELLAKEGITNVDDDAPAQTQTPPHPSAPLPSAPTGLPTTPHPPGHVISPNSQQQNGGVDPSSISL